ncbi:MAG TPA: nuclear transport factor 2 family protein [Thermoleophilaceae bacterium]
MNESNVAVVQALFDGYAERGIEGVLEVMHDEVVIEIPPDLSAEPDNYYGHEGVRRYFQGFTGMIDDVRYEPLALIPRGERVIAHIVLSGRGASSGLDVDLEAAVVHDFKDAKIVRMRPYPDLESAEAAIR